jgi:hypothetical protein
LAGFRLLPVFLGSALCCGAVLATAQDNRPPTGPVPALGQTEQAPAVIDTAVAVLEFSTPEVSPAALHVFADTVLFGETVQLVVDIQGSWDQEPEWKVIEGDQWLVAEPADKPGLRDRILGSGSSPRIPTEDLPAFDGHRVTASFRVYRNQPFRVQVGDHLGPVIQVKTRISGTGEAAAIRAPRPVGMSPLVILGLLAALVVLLLGVWVFWARGPGRDQLEDREIPPPAWLAAAVELRDLFWEGSLGRGETRPYLDGLAGIARRFVAGRYRISAQDMTGREIISACGGLGHPITNPGAFARMIDELDHRRYDPAASTPGWCREQTVQLYEQVGLVRVIPRYTEVPPEDVLEAEKAWKILAREFAGATGRGRITDAGPGKKEA